jgi:hypothetical protein
MAAPNKVLWANNVVNDPTTLQDNRRALTATEQSEGFTPAFVQPPRQAINQVLYELAKWTEYLKDEYLPFGGEYEKYIEGRSNGVYMLPQAIWSNSNDLNIDQSRIGAMMYNSSDITDISPYHLYNGTIISKDNEVSWSVGNGGGLKSYAGTPSNIFVHLFIIGKVDSAGVIDSNSVDFATDTDINGANIIANVFPLFSYTHLKRIAVLPYIDNGGRKFADFMYGHDDYIMYGQEQLVSPTTASTSSSTFGDLTLTLQAPIAANAAPDENTDVMVDFRGNPLGTAAMLLRSKYTGLIPYGYFRATPSASDHFVAALNARNSIIEVASGVAVTNAQLDFTVLGYKNTAVARPRTP